MIKKILAAKKIKHPSQYQMVSPYVCHTCCRAHVLWTEHEPGPDKTFGGEESAILYVWMYPINCMLSRIFGMYQTMHREIGTG